MLKIDGFLRIWFVRRQPLFARNEVRVPKIAVFFNFTSSAATPPHGMNFERQAPRVFCEFGLSGGNFCARNEVRMSKNRNFWGVRLIQNIFFARNEVRVPYSDVFLRDWLVLEKSLRLKVFVCKSVCIKTSEFKVFVCQKVCVSKRLRVKASVCESVSVQK